MAVMARRTEAVTLPQNLFVSGPTLLESFESALDWFASTGTVADTDVAPRHGTGAIKITTPQGSVAQAYKTVNWTFSGNAGPIEIAIYPHTDVDTTWQLLNIAMEVSPGRYFAVSPSGSGLVKDTWNTVYIGRERWTAMGGALWSDTITKITVNLYPKTGQVNIVSLDALYQAEPMAAVILGFDDHHISVWDEAFPYMRARGVRGTAYTITNRIGLETYMTLNQLLALDAAGWDIANHTHRHIGIDSLATALAEYGGARDALNAVGLTRASAHVAYPYGGTSVDIFTAMQQLGLLTGRLVTLGPIYMPHVADWHQIPGGANLNSATTLTMAKADIDEAITKRQVATFFGHRLAAEADATVTWAIDDLRALVNYIVETGITPITISELYRLRTESVTVRRFA